MSSKPPLLVKVRFVNRTGALLRLTVDYFEAAVSVVQRDAAAVPVYRHGEWKRWLVPKLWGGVSRWSAALEANAPPCGMEWLDVLNMQCTLETAYDTTDYLVLLSQHWIEDHGDDPTLVLAIGNVNDATVLFYPDNGGAESAVVVLSSRKRTSRSNGSNPKDAADRTTVARLASPDATDGLAH